jgi:hypothetical protein
MNEQVTAPSPAGRVAEHVLRLILSVAAVAFLWVAVDRLVSFQQHAAQQFRFEVSRWVLVLAAAIAAGFLAGVAMALPLGRGYRPLRVLVLGLPPAVFLAQFVVNIWWVFRRLWKGHPWWVDWPRLFFSPAAQLALGILFGLALAAGFRTRHDGKAERPRTDPSVGPGVPAPEDDFSPTRVGDASAEQPG